MPDSLHPDQLTFKIHPAGGGSEVPVALLTQSLTTIQELIHLLEPAVGGCGLKMQHGSDYRSGDKLQALNKRLD